MVDVLTKDGIISERCLRTLGRAGAHGLGRLSSMVIPPDVIKQIRGEEARRFKVIPVAFNDSGLVVAVSDPLDIDTIDSLGFLLQREIEVVCSSPEKVREALIKYYGTADEASDVLQETHRRRRQSRVSRSRKAARLESDNEADAPIIRLVSLFLIEAHRAGRERYSPRAAR